MRGCCRGIEKLLQGFEMLLRGYREAAIRVSRELPNYSLCQVTLFSFTSAASVALRQRPRRGRAGGDRRAGPRRLVDRGRARGEAACVLPLVDIPLLLFFLFLLFSSLPSFSSLLLYYILSLPSLLFSSLSSRPSLPFLTSPFLPFPIPHSPLPFPILRR